MPRLFLASAVLTVVALAVSGCGRSDEEKIRAVVNEFQRSLQRHDAKHACGLLTPRAEAQFTGFFGAFSGGGGDCVKVLRKATSDEDEGPSARDIDRGKVAIRGDRATLEPRGDEGRLGLRKVDGEWRIDNVLNPSLDEKPRRLDPRLARGSDEEQVRATLGALHGALAGKEYERACDLFSDRAQAQILVGGGFAALLRGSEANDASTPSCARVLPRLAELDDDENSIDPVPAAALEAADVSIRGERATVTIPGEDPAGLIRMDGHWLVDVDPSESPESSGRTTAAEYERCWRRAGAEIASRAGDLRFAAADSARTIAVSPERVSVKGDDWRVFYTLPADGEDPGLPKVVAKPSTVPVVAYVRDAPAQADVVARARACGSQKSTFTFTVTP